MEQVPRRIRAFDWLRGLAVLVMVETHSLVFLRPELRVGPFARQLNFANGLVAPSFIFASGFSLALVQVRSALSQGTGLSRPLRLRRTLRRVGEVLAVGALVNYIWFPIRVEPVWLLRLDILPCIGVSLLLALPLIFTLAPRPRALAGALFLWAVAAFGAAPLFEHVRGPWANVVNRSGSLNPVFPLLPWAGYVFLGAAFGTLAASRSLTALKRALLGFLAVCIAVACLGPLFVRIYPEHAFAVSDPANHAQRLSCVGVLLMGLLALEGRAGPGFRASRPVRFVELFGTTSLAAYFFHEELLFFSFFGHSLAGQFRDRCGWGGLSALLLGVWTATALLVLAVDRLYPRWEALLKALMAPRAPTAVVPP